MTVLVVDFSTVSSNPLNPLGLNLRRLIWESLDNSLNDNKITSIILTGCSKNGSTGNFSAGADLTEFGQLQQQLPSSNNSNNNNNNEKSFYPLSELILKIENYPKPIIAAIDGVALGGGLEVALACHYRISSPKANLGLPEVNVGVIPGAGGTQRLPRLVGVSKALEVIVSGKSISASEGKKLGLIDDIIVSVDSKRSELLPGASKWAKWSELMPLNDRRVGQLKIKESQDELKQIFDMALRKLPSPEMGGEGVHAALEAIKACVLPIEDGTKIEFEQFIKTLTGSQGMARRHAFFAIRSAQKPLGKPPITNHPLLQRKPGQVVSVAVVGAGLMGSGIAMVLLQAGFQVCLVDLYKQSLEKGTAFIQSTIQSKAKRGKLSTSKATSMIQNLTSSQRLDDVSSCKLVVEAVIEDMKIKKSIFSQLEKITSSECILLSNTSTLDIDEMASALTSSNRRSKFAGWHFFSPAHVMKLVEIVVGKETSLETTCIMQQLTKKVGKIGVVCGNCDGFIGNRLLISYGAETTLMLEEGVATVASVDKAFLKFGIALGPFQMADLAGLDIGYNIRKQRGWISQDGSPSPRTRPERYPEIADVIVSQYKRLGQKSGKGWYDYDKKIGHGRKSLPSKEVDMLVRKYAKSTTAAQFSDKEMIERVLFPLVNEGFKCLEEGIANQPSDIDVVYLYGYGWPVYRGGPMYWADNEIGLPYLLSRLRVFYKQFPTTDYYKPSRLLETCVMMDLTVQEYYERGLHKKQSHRVTSKL